MLGVGGVIVDGAEAAIYVAETGATIIAGENARITMDMRTLKDKFEPIAAVAGGVGYMVGVKNYMKAEKAASALGRQANNLARGVSAAGGDAASSGMKQVAAMAAERADRAAQAALNAGAEGVAATLDFIGDDLAKYLNENDVLEIDIAPGATTATAVNIGGMTEEEAAGALMDAGILPPVESEAKTHAEIAEGMEEDGVLTEEELRKLLAQWTQEMIDLLEETEEVLDELVEEIEKAEAMAGGPISIEEAAGVYDVDDGEEVGHYVFNVNADGYLIEDDRIFEYDSTTGIATDIEHGFKFEFTRENDKIRVAFGSITGYKRPDLPPGGLYMEELFGRYEGTIEDDRGVRDDIVDVRYVDEDTLNVRIFNGKYDPLTATMKGDVAEYKFTKVDGVIHMSGGWWINEEEGMYVADEGHMVERRND